MTTERKNNTTPAAAVVTTTKEGEETVSSATMIGDDSAKAKTSNPSSDSTDVDQQEPKLSATNKSQQHNDAETTKTSSSSKSIDAPSSSSSGEQKNTAASTSVPTDVSSSSIPEGESKTETNGERKSLAEQEQPSPPSTKPVKDPIQEGTNSCTVVPVGTSDDMTVNRPKLVPSADSQQPQHTIEQTDKTQQQQASSSSHQRVPYNDSMSIGSVPSGLDASTNSGGGGNQQITHSLSQEPQQRPQIGAPLCPSTPTPPPVLPNTNSHIQAQTQQQLTKSSTSSHSTTTTPRQGVDHQVTENQQRRQSIPLAPQLNTAAAVPVQGEEQQTTTGSHRPVALVALSVQQNRSEQQVPLQPQNLASVTEAGAGGHPQQQSQQQQQRQQQQPQQGQTEQTIYYQIPSVVTIGPTTTQENQSNAVNVGYASHNQDEHHQQYPSGLQQPYLPQQQLQEVIQNPPEQVIGMVGAIPIVKLQTGSLHLVKKKKGRFKLLGDTPAVATTNAAIVGGAPVVPVGVVSSSQPATTTAGQQQLPSNTTFIPTNITIPTTTQQGHIKGQSMSSTISQHSGNAGAMPAPQTFDGTSAPTVKKKGRFVVTNVKDPGSIPLNIQNPQQGQQQQQHPSTTMGDQQQQASQWDMGQNSNQSISLAQQQQQQPQQQLRQRENSHQSLHQNANQQSTMVPHHERTGSSLPSMAEIPRGPPQQQQQQQQQQVLPHASQQTPGPSTVDSYQAHVFIHQPATIYQQEKGGGGPENVQQQMTLPQHPLPPPPPPVANQAVTIDSLSQIQNNQGLDSSRLQTVGQYLTPPQTPSTTGASAPNSPRQQRTAQSMITPATATFPKPVQTNADKARNSESRKKTVQAGTGKLPQTVDKNGGLSAGGLGKVFYLLDQMKNEVTGADRTIKTLQTDMKLMRDKNKELEAKVRELESKVKEEKALREKAESRNIELRKRIRDTAKGEVAGAKQVDQQLEDGKNVRSKEVSTTEKQVISDVGKEKAINSANASKMTPNTVQGNPQALSATGGASVSSSSEKGRAPVQPKAGNLPPKSAASPLPKSHNRPKAASAAPSGENQGKNATNLTSGGKHTRSHSFHPESSSALNVRNSGSETVQATPSKGSSTPNTWPNENPGQAAPSRPPPVYPNPVAGGQNGSNVIKPQCVSDFDPLKPNITSSGPASHQSEVMPIISLSALEAVPINPAAAYANAGTNLTAQLNPGPFLSETNQYVVYGMAPATAVGPAMNGDIHRSVPNAHGFHEQPIMVFPQQQPIMFQQFGGMQPVPNMIQTGPPANTIQMQQPSAYYHHGQIPHYDNHRQSQQSPCHNNGGPGPNPFDAFSTASDPFDDIVPRQLPPNQVT